VAFIADPYGFGVSEAREAQILSESSETISDDIEEDSESSEASDEESRDASDEANSEKLKDLDADFGETIPEIDPEQVEAEMMRLTQVMEEENAKEEKALEALADESPVQIKEEAEANLGEIFEQERLLDRDESEEEAPLDLDQVEMESCLEALLFMSDKPLSAEKLQELLGPEMTLNRFQEALTSLKDRYQKAFHGIELTEVAGGYQFRTKPGRAVLAKKLARVQAQRLSGGAMETLAIVAYKQPVLKDDIDKIRGVDSSHFIRGLLDKKLIRISGRSDLPGRPMLYSTSPDFLELFGLKDLNALPTLREIEQMVPTSQGGKGEEFEDPRVREMRKLVQEMKTDTSVNLIYDPREDEKFLQDIREKVQSIPTSTPYLDEQKALGKEKLAAEKQVKSVEGLEAMMPLTPEATPESPGQI
jgi:segregation and condensation protein B